MGNKQDLLYKLRSLHWAGFKGFEVISYHSPKPQTENPLVIRKISRDLGTAGAEIISGTLFSKSWPGTPTEEFVLKCLEIFLFALQN